MGGILPNPGQDAFNVARLSAIAGLSAPILAGAITDYVSTGKLDLPGLPKPVADALLAVIGDAEATVGGPLFDALISSGLGISGLGAPGTQEEAAVATIKRALGFGIGLPIVAGAAEVPLKALLGPHLGATIFDALKNVSEEAGISFFLGLTLSNIFETAVGEPLREAIAQRTRPARFDFRVVKLLLQKHHLTPDQGRQYLERIGYRDQDIAAILELEEAFLSVADLQLLFLMGLRTEAQVADYLGGLGYSAADTADLIQLYLGKAETQGGQQLRATARQGYLDGKITAAEYRSLLESVFTPTRSIDLEIQSADLLLSWGRRQLSVANLKQLHQQGHINDRQAEVQLERIGFTQDDALSLIDTWTVERKSTHPGLTVNRILSFQLGGIITRAQSLGLLQETGMRVEDASLLAANPGRLGGVYAHELTQATILSALREGIIDTGQAAGLFDGLGVNPEERDLAITATIAKAIRGSKPRAAHKSLTEPQVLEAVKLNLVSTGWAAAELATLGYTDADAQLILAIEYAKSNGAAPDGWVILS